MGPGFCPEFMRKSGSGVAADQTNAMLATSKDHTLFGPIYTDFEDIDEDGVIDTTFKPDFKYYGYFDARNAIAMIIPALSQQR